jgi:hypothetical protein
MMDFFKDLFSDPKHDSPFFKYLYNESERNTKIRNAYSGVLKKNLDRYFVEVGIGNIDRRVAMIDAIVETTVIMHVLRHMIQDHKFANMEKLDLVVIDFFRRGTKSDYWLEAEQLAKKYTS